MPLLLASRLAQLRMRGCSRMEMARYRSERGFGGRPRVRRVAPCLATMAFRAIRTSAGVTRRALSKGNFFTRLILSPFASTCMARTDQTVHSATCPHGKYNDCYITQVGFPDEPLSFLFLGRMFDVRSTQRHGIVKRRHRLLKTDAMFSLVVHRLPRVPFEPHLLYIL